MDNQDKEVIEETDKEENIEAPAKETSDETEKKRLKKTGNKKLIIIITAVITVIAIGFWVWYFELKNDGNSV